MNKFSIHFTIYIPSYTYFYTLAEIHMPVAAGVCTDDNHVYVKLWASRISTYATLPPGRACPPEVASRRTGSDDFGEGRGGRCQDTVFHAAPRQGAAGGCRTLCSVCVCVRAVLSKLHAKHIINSDGFSDSIISIHFHYSKLTNKKIWFQRYCHSQIKKNMFLSTTLFPALQQTQEQENR